MKTRYWEDCNISGLNLIGAQSQMLRLIFLLKAGAQFRIWVRLQITSHTSLSPQAKQRSKVKHLPTGPLCLVLLRLSQRDTEINLLYKSSTKATWPLSRGTSRVHNLLYWYLHTTSLCGFFTKGKQVNNNGNKRKVRTGGRGGGGETARYLLLKCASSVLYQCVWPAATGKKAPSIMTYVSSWLN